MGQKRRDADDLMDVARDFEVVMFCTVAPDGSVHARPMLVLDVDEAQSWWFVTSRATGKVDELAHDGHVTVTAQGRRAFATLTGQATVTDDRAKLARLWRRELDAWFRGGPDDRDAVLIRFSPAVGEYWEHGWVDAVKLRLDQARDLFTGRGAPTRPTRGDHAKVSLPSSDRAPH